MNDSREVERLVTELLGALKFYHGTTDRLKRLILRKGLRAGSYVSDEKFVAEGYARSYHEGEKVGIVTVTIPQNLILTYLDSDVESTVEVIKTIPPEFLS